MQILDGKAVSEARRQRLKAEIAALKGRPGLAVVLIGDDKASHVYVANKIKACHELGIESIEVRLPATVSAKELQGRIQALNQDEKVHGILVQLPLPRALDPREVIGWVDPNKDADCLTMNNLGRLWAGDPLTAPCTPAGVMAILKHYDLKVAGANAVVVGRSQIVGRPMAHLLSSADATVTICHSKTKNLREHLLRADIAVIAAGQPEFLGGADFAKDAVVIDVGIHRKTTAEGKTKLCGDVRFSELNVRAATPVPGGVGPMTITMLMENTLRLYKAAL